MNRFESFKAKKILLQYPSVTTLPFKDRWLARLFGHEETFTLEVKEGLTVYFQTAILVLWKGNRYVKRFEWKR